MTCLCVFKYIYTDMYIFTHIRTHISVITMNVDLKNINKIKRITPNKIFFTEKRTEKKKTTEYTQRKKEKLE
jgi:hypothetical protein